MADLTQQLNAALSGRYRIERELGRGGMATVFLAEDLRHPRQVAIKVLDHELAAAVGTERFLREIRIAAGLSHPHIVPLFDSGAADGLLYYVMPYAEGESLRHRLAREKQLPLEDSLRIAREVADALDHAHRHDLVHRDIKPENILLSGQHAVVADFGIARAVAAAGGKTLTATGVSIGTPAYMSPEQTLGSSEVDGRADQYALGCVLYEMLAGQPPFTGPTAESLKHQHANVQPRPVTELRTSVPAPVSGAIARALAKTPADRFGSTAEFSAAITPSGSGAVARINTSMRTVEVARGGPDASHSDAARGRGLKGVLALALALAAVVAIAKWRGWGPFAGVPAAQKDWILVAEFDGPPADSTVVAATRDLVMAAIDQSEIVATVPPDQIRLALLSADKPTSRRVDAELARELAVRSSVRTVLEGRIGRLGNGYSMVLRLVDADSARVVLSVSDVAADERALIPTVDRIAKRLRAELGERRSAIRATNELSMLTTPSFEAYRTFVRGRTLLFGGDYRAAITWCQKALTIDPDMAPAWLAIATCYGNLDEPDSALAAFRQCLARPKRLPERGRLMAVASCAYLSGNLPGALAAIENAVQLLPQVHSAHTNKGFYLMRSGRWSEALESERTAETVSPIGPNQIILLNQLECLLVLGRLDEARHLVPRLRGRIALKAPMDIATAAGQWRVAESLATVLRSTAAADDDLRREAATVLAAVQASQGQVKAADEMLRQAQSAAETRHDLSRADWTRWDRLGLALFSRGAAADPGYPGNWDSTTAGLVAHGAWAAATGDTMLALRLAATIRKRSAPDLARQGFFGPGLVEAWIAARTGNWQEVVRLLGPAAQQGEALGYAQVQSAPLIRWLVAEAYDQVGRPDSAAAYLERAIAPVPEGGTNFVQIRMASSFAHGRLMLLYTRLGRLEAAQQHWQALAATFTHPDPDMKPLLEQARTALASAEAMPKPARR